MNIALMHEVLKLGAFGSSGLGSTGCSVEGFQGRLTWQCGCFYRL